jgi:RHS repeat-associated protein
VTADAQIRIWPANVQYDGYGNVTYLPALTMNLGYDVANRMVSANSTTYAYDQANLRVYSSSPETVYLYGSGGQKLATYTISVSNTAIGFTLASNNVYFAGRLINGEDNNVASDTLGSVRWSASTGQHSYFPFGVEYAATANDTEKYATYTRDNATGLDYAVNRYYASNWGRFLSPDPSSASAEPADPRSWNRYAYVGGDPANHADPTGQYVDPFDPGGNVDPTASFLSAQDCIDDPQSCVDADLAGWVFAWPIITALGGGGGTGSGGDGGCATNPPAGSRVPPCQRPPSCTISVVELGAGGMGGSITHTVVETGTHSGPFGQIAANYEAYPQAKTAAQNPLHLPWFFGGSWLDKTMSIGSPATGRTVWSDSGPHVCLEDAVVSYEYTSWKDSSTSYYVNFQNSNSFSFWLLYESSVKIPLWAEIVLEHTAPGWGWYPLGQ